MRGMSGRAEMARTGAERDKERNAQLCKKWKTAVAGIQDCSAGVRDVRECAPGGERSRAAVYVVAWVKQRGYGYTFTWLREQKTSVTQVETRVYAQGGNTHGRNHDETRRHA